MIVQDLVETKQYFVGETKPEFYVIYGKYENSDAMFRGKDFHMSEIEIEEVVKVLHGDEHHSLRPIESYTIGEDYPSIDAILAKVKQQHRDIFI